LRSSETFLPRPPAVAEPAVPLSGRAPEIARRDAGSPLSSHFNPCGPPLPHRAHSRGFPRTVCLCASLFAGHISEPRQCLQVSGPLDRRAVCGSSLYPTQGRRCRKRRPGQAPSLSGLPVAGVNACMPLQIAPTPTPPTAAPSWALAANDGRLHRTAYGRIVTPTLTQRLRTGLRATAAEEL